MKNLRYLLIMLTFLLVGSALLYSFFLKDSFKEFKYLTEFYQFESRESNIDIELKQLFNLSDSLDQSLNFYLKNTELDKQIWSTFNQLANKYDIVIVDYANLEIIEEENEIQPKINKIMLQGCFHDILNYIRELEEIKAAGRILSIDFQKIKTTKTNIAKLNCTIYVRNFTIL